MAKEATQEKPSIGKAAAEPVKLTPEKESKKLRADLEVMQTKFDSLVNFVNDFRRDVQDQVGNIDNVAFAALALHEGKEYKPSAVLVASTREHIEKVIKSNNDYREELKAAAEKAHAKEAKAAEKKAKVQAKRDQRKGKVAKDAKKAD